MKGDRQGWRARVEGLEAHIRNLDTQLRDYAIIADNMIAQSHAMPSPLWHARNVVVQAAVNWYNARLTGFPETAQGIRALRESVQSYLDLERSMEDNATPSEPCPACEGRGGHIVPLDGRQCKTVRCVACDGTGWKA